METCIYDGDDTTVICVHCCSPFTIPRLQLLDSLHGTVCTDKSGVAVQIVDF